MRLKVAEREKRRRGESEETLGLRRSPPVFMETSQSSDRRRRDDYSDRRDFSSGLRPSPELNARSSLGWLLADPHTGNTHGFVAVGGRQGPSGAVSVPPETSLAVNANHSAKRNHFHRLPSSRAFILFSSLPLPLHFDVIADRKSSLSLCLIFSPSFLFSIINCFYLHDERNTVARGNKYRKRSFKAHFVCTKQ